MIRQLMMGGVLCSGLAMSCSAQAPRSWNSSEILQHIQQLKVLATVLYVGAHPDDENTRLLAYLVGERKYRTAYLSLTRGDGGQNLLGDEQGIELGLIRTQELLAARRIDGAEQFFSTAYDFGYSKSSQEALKIWGEDTILSDIVWVIRNFRPDVIITRFPEDRRAGHGHHSASAILAREAFAAAADPNRFPEQFRYGVTPWQARRIVWNSFNFGPGANTTSPDQLTLDVGTYNELLGKSYGEIAAESRSQHKSQGFGVAASRGSSIEYFSPVAGPPATHDIMDGVATDWSREGEPEMNDMVDAMVSSYDPLHPSNSLYALRKFEAALRKLPTGYWVKRKLNEVWKLEDACTGLWIEADVNQPYIVQGDTARVNVSMVNRGPENLHCVRISIGGKDTTLDVDLAKNTTVNVPVMVPVSSDAPLTQPYWLRKEKTEGHFVVDDQSMIGKPERDPALSARILLKDPDFPVQDSVREFDCPVMDKHTDPVRGELYDPLEITPPVLVYFEPPLILDNLDPAVHTEMKLTLVAQKNIDAKQLGFIFNDGLTSYIVTRPSQHFDKNTSYEFIIPYNAPFMEKARGKPVFVSAMIDGQSYDAGLTEITYPHIPKIHYFHGTSFRVIGESVKVKGKNIGYIQGAGDKLPVYLKLMGYEVTELNEQDLQGPSLDRYDAIITGIRAFNTQRWLRNVMPQLMNYVRNGGVLLEQYNNPNGLATTDLGPYELHISPGRVTDETAQVNFVDPQNPILHYPNEITQDDFLGWVQERGLYFIGSADSRYAAPLSMHDPGEQDMTGSLLVTDYGKGKFVYTSLAFFRQLPDGVPGAYRLFANLLAKPQPKR